jgi:orotate phosphoribosyltransferase
MQLIPTEQEVIELLKQTGALRYGHFEYPNGLHSDMYLQPALAMRHYETAKLLSVALSRKLRANSEIRAIIPELSIVAPATGGLPVAYGMCEALRAHQVYWAESASHSDRLRFRPHLEPKAGEKVLMVDDVLRTGKKLTELKTMIELAGAQVIGLAVLVYEPNPETKDFGSLPFFYLTRLDALYFGGKAAAETSARIPGQAEKVWI